MKIKCTPMTGSELKPGDLFSTAGPSYWDLISQNKSIGERVYIRTETPFENAPDSDALVYKIEIQ